MLIGFSVEKKFEEKLQVMKSISSSNSIGGPAFRWSGIPVVRLYPRLTGPGGAAEAAQAGLYAKIW